uniref:Suppressor of glucose, autophagy associated 1 n=1 Tax=Scophthalmus maximus TaxID=52904 RepID=A0A8D3CUT2_SCOMX
MLEMRDMYMEDDVYQLQELRQQLEQANKTCRILQYRLRKAERRSLRVAQTGQVDGELIRTLEQDVKVAKDVSIRLHNQLDSVEKKRSRLEKENEELRGRLQDLEVAKQVLQQEIDKVGSNRPKLSLSPRSVRSLQEDSSDLKCQLHFAKEESALMCKKLTKLVKDSEAMKEELAKFRSLYGDVDASLTVEEVADSPHTREAEIRVHLKLVEEEANLLSRRIVELEVENRGLRAEMDDMKGPQGRAMVLGGGAASENVMELQRHLQFVEEEAELLRRSLIEMEEQNKLLMNEINRYKSELPPLMSTLSTDTPVQEEELRLARLQIGELGGKVKKLQYENRVLLSNLQRCDLAAYNTPSSSSSSSSLRLALETDAEAGDSAECLPSRYVSLTTFLDEIMVLQCWITNLPCHLLLALDVVFLFLNFPPPLSSLAVSPPVTASILFLIRLTTLYYSLSSACVRLRFPPDYPCFPIHCSLTHLHSLRPPSLSLLPLFLLQPYESPDLQTRLSEAEESAQETQEELENERPTQKETALKLTQVMFLSQLQEGHQKALLRRDFQLQSLGLQARLQQKLWGQERTLLVQESQHLKQALLLLSLKLRCFLKQWRLGCKKDTECKDILEMNSLKDLYLLLEEENLTSPAHQSDKRSGADEQPSTLADLRVSLQDLSGELRQERQGSQELTQQFAKAKASWEVERTELQTLSSTDTMEPPDLKVALKREREEHQHLLAESYGAVMDLTKQLQIGERNWGREKLELLERFSQERAQWEQRVREATAQQGKVRLCVRACVRACVRVFWLMEPERMRLNV